MISVRCPQCGRDNEFAATSAGQRLRCSCCQSQLVIPEEVPPVPVDHARRNPTTDEQPVPWLVLCMIAGTPLGLVGCLTVVEELVVRWEIPWPAVVFVIYPVAAILGTLVGMIFGHRLGLCMDRSRWRRLALVLGLIGGVVLWSLQQDQLWAKLLAAQVPLAECRELAITVPLGGLGASLVVVLAERLQFGSS